MVLEHVKQFIDRLILKKLWRIDIFKYLWKYLQKIY